jgi:hypothetical protein
MTYFHKPGAKKTKQASCRIADAIILAEKARCRLADKSGFDFIDKNRNNYRYFPYYL